MAELPTVDQLLGSTPTVDELFGQPNAFPRSFDHPMTSAEFQDYVQNHSSIGRVVKAFSGEAADSFGSAPVGLSPETIKWLRQVGIYNDYEKRNATIGRAITESVLTPSAAALDAFLRGSTAAFRGGQAAVQQAGTELGQPQLGRDIAAMPEAFFGSPHPMAVPEVPDLPKAQELGVIGAGEAGWKGTASPNFSARFDNEVQSIKAQAEAAKTETPEAPTDQPAQVTVDQPAPDIHAVARQIAPETFTKFDALNKRKETFRRWIGDLQTSRDNRVAAEAPHAAEIDALQKKMEGVTPRLQKKYQARLDDLIQERDRYIEENTQGDSPDMARIRQRMMETDYAMRDLAPEVGQAYRAAQERMPQEPVSIDQPVAAEPPPEAQGKPVEAPPQEATPAETTPAETAPVADNAPQARTVPPPSFDDVKHISEDVAQKLIAAGRPQEEADAAGKLIASHYWARAARFNGAKGNGLDLYKADAPEIKVGRSRRVKEYAQGGRQTTRAGKISVADNARNTITLFKNADASTFIHETGHQWLEELMQDAADQAAPDDLVRDAQTVRDWLGVKEGEQIPTRAHEKFARGFETYMMEGRAPSTALARVFEQFRQWLTSIYQTVAKLRAPINNDIRDVFDRLVTAKPDKTVIAPDRETAKDFADIHEADAESTPPEKAREVANTIRGERDQVAAQALPEMNDVRLANVTNGAGRHEAGGPEPNGNVNAAGPDSGPTGNSQEPGKVGASGSQTPEESNRLREDPNAVLPERDSEYIDKAGNIRLDNLNTPADINEVLKQAAEENGDFMDQRGVVPDAEVLKLAEAAGVEATALDMKSFADTFGKGGLASKIVRLRQMLVQSAVSVRDAMAKAADGTEADVLAYAKAKTRHQMIQGTLSAVTAEAGRALRAFREIEGMKEAQAITDFLRDATGRTLFQLRQEAQLGMNLDTSAKVSKFVHDSAKPNFGDMVLEYWINGLISGPATHTTYSVGNALLALWKAGPETTAASIVGSILHALGGEGERVMLGEVPAQAYGLMRGVRNGIVAAYESAKSGRTTMLPGELENMSARQLQMSPLVNPRMAIPGPIGTLVRLPSRGIAIIHSFFRAMNYEREMAALAYRQATMEGLDGDRLSARIGELEQNPPEELMKKARASATDLTLMGKGGDLTQALTRLTNAKFLGFQWLKFIDPFVHISSNVIEQSLLQRTPLGVLDPHIRADLMGTNGPVARDMAIARMAVGSALAVGVGSLAAEGMVNGAGPNDPKEARVYTMVKGPPHSVRIGDVWYSVNRLGPLGMLLGVAADMYEFAHAISTEDATHLASRLTHAFTQNILDESFMRGPSDLIKALTDPDRYGASYVRNFLSSFVPFSVGMSQVARGIDPYSRSTRTIADSVIAKVPWLSETLLPRYDIFGRPVPNKDALGVAGLSAIYEQRVNNDPVAQSLLKIGVFPSMPGRKIRGVDLTDEQYAQYSQLSGQNMHMALSAIVTMPGFDALPQNVQHDLIVKHIMQARERARNVMMMRYPDIISKALDAKLHPITKH